MALVCTWQSVFGWTPWRVTPNGHRTAMVPDSVPVFGAKNGGLQSHLGTAATPKSSSHHDHDLVSKTMVVLHILHGFTMGSPIFNNPHMMTTGQLKTVPSCRLLDRWFFRAREGEPGPHRDCDGDQIGWCLQLRVCVYDMYTCKFYYVIVHAHLERCQPEENCGLCSLSERCGS